MPFTNYGLNHLISQKLPQLSQCKGPEVTSNFPESERWVSNFALNSFLGYDVPPEAKRFIFFFLRRAEAAFVEYDHTRGILSEYVEADRRRKPSLYFRALYHFEMTIAMEVLEKRESRSRPGVGIVKVKTTGFNQNGKTVITFERTIMVYKRDSAPQVARLTPAELTLERSEHEDGNGT